jgi:uncharacterized protein YqgC (DUF456 family)
MTQKPMSPHPMAVAMTWVARIFAVAIEMVLPGVAGSYGDRYFGVSFLALLGFAVGVSLGVYHLIVMTRPASADKPSANNKSSDDSD